MTAEIARLIYMGNEGTTIEEASNVRLSLVLAICAALIGGIWWASALQTKVDMLLANSAQHIAADASQNASIADIKHEMDILKLRIADIERKTKGTP